MIRFIVWMGAGLMLTVLLGFFSISLSEDEKWTKKADMPTARYALAASTANGKIYAIGGFGIGGPRLDVHVVLPTVEEYDPVTDKRTKKADMPTARAWLATSVVNEKIYAFGGNSDILSIVVEYDPKRDKWTNKAAAMPTGRYALAASTANGKIYAIGGYKWEGENLSILSTVEEYDPVTDKWTKKADMPTARAWLATSVVNEKIYAFGGLIDRLGPRKPPPPPLLTVEEYDPATNTWTKKTDMPTARWSLATSAVNGKIYAIGGAPGASVVEEYDPVTDTWTKKADMPTERYALAASTANGKIYAIGGRKGAFLPTVEEYDPGFAGEGEGIEAKGKLPTSWGKIKSMY